MMGCRGFCKPLLTMPSALRTYGMFRGFCNFDFGTLPGSIIDVTILPETAWNGKRVFRTSPFGSRRKPHYSQSNEASEAFIPSSVEMGIVSQPSARFSLALDTT